MRVNDYYQHNNVCKGWIRWRNGRDILVGSIINGRKIPDVLKAQTREFIGSWYKKAPEIGSFRSFLMLETIRKLLRVKPKDSENPG
jgi:hypothetical protein